MARVECPAGCVGGKMYHLGVDRTIECVKCQGHGWVDPDSMCACGRPAYYEAEGFTFCGRKDCLTELKTPVKPYLSAQEFARQNFTRGWGQDSFMDQYDS